MIYGQSWWNFSCLLIPFDFLEVNNQRQKSKSKISSTADMTKDTTEGFVIHIVWDLLNWRTSENWRLGELRGYVWGTSMHDLVDWRSQFGPPFFFFWSCPVSSSGQKYSFPASRYWMLYWNVPEWGEIALKFTLKLLRKPSASYHIGSVKVYNSALADECLHKGLLSVKERTEKKKKFTYHQHTNYNCFWLRSKYILWCESRVSNLGLDIYHLTHAFSSSSPKNNCEQEAWKIFFFFLFSLGQQRAFCF